MRLIRVQIVNNVVDFVLALYKSLILAFVYRYSAHSRGFPISHRGSLYRSQIRFAIEPWFVVQISFCSFISGAWLWEATIK